MSNTITDIIPKILGRTVSYLRANSVMPRLCNRDFDGAAQMPGATINVPLPPTPTVTAVAASATQPSNVDRIHSTVAVNLDQHYESAFYLTDQERTQIMAGAEQTAIDTHIKALCDYIDLSTLTAMDLAASIGTGTAATTPFATLALALDPIQYLDTHKTSRLARHVVFNPRAQMNLLGLSGFTSMDFTGDMSAMLEGTFAGNRRAGAQWWMNQNCPTHTAGTGSGITTSGSHAIGTTVIATTGGSGTILAGDVISFAADTANKYVVATALGGGNVTIAAPGLKATIPTGNAITVSASHTANFAFSREDVVFVSRPFVPSAAAIAVDQVTDPVSGLTVRVEVTRQNKQDKWSIDALWGHKVIRPQGVIKVMG